jgi:SpoIID/LytB domain protein
VSSLRRSLVAAVVMAGALAPLPEASFASTPPPPGDTSGLAASASTPVVLSGSGFGHGVGMSQYGAYAMAVAGASVSNILSFYYQGAALGSVADPSVGLGPIAVGIVRGAPQLTLSVSGRSGGADHAEIRSGSPAGPVVGTCAVDTTCVIQAANGQVQLAGSPATGTRAQPLFVMVEQQIGPVFVRVAEWGHTASHGYIEVLPTPTDPNLLNGVNVIDLDYAYVAGIAEVPSSWPAAALDAQAIAARTYAWQRHRGGSCDCDVTADTFDQVYAGWDKEQQQPWADAANRTRSQAVLFNGQKISAFYSSSSGGRTEANEDAFGGSPIPYLRSIDDPWSLTPANPYRTWQRSFSAAQAATDFGLDRVLGVAVTARTQGGSIARAVVSGVKNGVGVTTSYTGSDLRFILSLPSTHASVPQSSFDEYLLLYNPATSDAHVAISFLLSGGEAPIPLSVVVPAGTRQTIHVNDYVPFREVSASVHSDVPVVAERAMYFVYQGKWAGGDASEGVVAPSQRWLLAEGYDAPNFDTYNLIANPGASPTTAHVRLLGGDGHTATVDLPLAPHSRGTIRLNDVPGFSFGDVSTDVTADQPVVAERSEYFDYTGLDGSANFSGGDAAPGVPAPATTWYLAEGYTAEQFITFLLLENPGDVDAHPALTFLRPAGSPVLLTPTVAAHSRRTFLLNQIPGLEATEVSTKVASDVPIAAEHALYFNYHGWIDGSNHHGVTAPQTTWYLAEGYAAPNFDTYVLIANPDPTQTAHVSLEFHQNAGLAGTRSLDVPPQSRRTVKVNDSVAGDVSTVLRSNIGVVVERSMYFDYYGRQGGSDAVGASSPSTDWFFAEGYTGS